MTKQKIKKLALIKWEYAYETGCEGYILDEWLKENHTNIYNFLSNCPFCEKWDGYYGWECRQSKCPLNVAGQNCYKYDSYWAKWDKAKTIKTRKKYAKLILDIINDY